MASLLLASAVLVGLLTALLVIPIDIAFAAAAKVPDEPVSRVVQLRWLFGLLELRLERPRTGRLPHRRAKRQARRAAKRSRRPRIRRLLFNPTFWAQLKRLLQRLAHAVHWRTLRLHVLFGLDDPADTGCLWGVLGPLSTALFPAHADVVIQPTFEGPVFAFQGTAEVRVVPLRIARVLLLFALSPATWRALRPVWRSR
jgi:hypothetical protein